jgi:hypothetical protein
MKIRTILVILIISATVLLAAAGCRDTDFKTEKIEDSFYVFIEFPTLQREFTEGYPKEIKATAYLGDKELKRKVTYIWNSDRDGDIAQGPMMSTEHLSIGNHTITLTAYYKNDRTATETAEIRKVNRPMQRTVEKEVLKPRRYTDRIDGTVYVDNRDGTVTDTITKRMWEKSDDGYPKTVYEAYQYCESLKLAGYNDWRMPTIDELQEIANISLYKKEPIICDVFDTKTSTYWSRTRSNFKLSKHPERNFYHSVEFKHSQDRNGLHGKTVSVTDEYSQRYVRCVR